MELVHDQGAHGAGATADADEEGAARLEEARAKLRGMWELPSVAHFAKVFSQPLRLRKFTPDVSALLGTRSLVHHGLGTKCSRGRRR